MLSCLHPIFLNSNNSHLIIPINTLGRLFWNAIDKDENIYIYVQNHSKASGHEHNLASFIT
jgi:hypothetical protein